MNILLQEFQTPFKTVPFDQIKEEDFLPGLEEAITLSKKNVTDITNNSENASFNNTIEAFEYSTNKVDLISNIFFNLHSAEASDKLQKIAKDFSPLLTEFQDDILLNEKLFSRVKNIYEKKSDLNLNSEENMLLEKQYKLFLRNGALLNDEDKKRKREISKRLSELSLHFSDHILNEMNSYVLWCDDLKKLDGIPENVITVAKKLAEQKNEGSKWAFTLHYPSFGPFIAYCKDRKLREEIWRVSASKAFKNDKNDNQKIILEMLKLKNENAKLLGYKDHAEFILEERMAENSKTVMSFIDEIIDTSMAQATKDIDDVKKIALELDNLKDFSSWDYSFYKEILKEKQLKFNEEDLKPYFKFENVVDGAFLVANKLYGIKFRERKDIAKYHEDVLTYEVQDENDRLIGVFYVDLFPRAGKRSGAWMTEFKKQYKKDGENYCPHTAIVCNFTRPTKEHPSLLTLNEVSTLFHEFGHALHGLLSDCTYPSLSSPDVYWDFVELPSQIMENWVFEKECLELFAKHHITGEIIPDELIKKVKKTLTFQVGMMTIRQMNFSALDMAWHTCDPSTIDDISTFEKKVMDRSRLMPHTEGTNMSCSFSHIFAGGYSAGYYSYKWAEVLDADAFESFKENGIFNKETAKSFRDNILAKGGSVHPMELYKKFKGRKPDPKALLRRAGLI